MGDIVLSPWIFWASSGILMLISQAILHNIGVRAPLYFGIGCLAGAVATVATAQTAYTNIGTIVMAVVTFFSWLLLRKRLAPKQ